MSKFIILLTILAILGVVFSNLVIGEDAHSFPKPHAIHNLGQLPKRNTEKRNLQGGPKGTELTPLFPGYGTHFAYAYVGTPGQRVSLIVDTGSHYTAFPCIGCTKCGKHTDPYWNIKNSSTAVVPQCTEGKKSSNCEISQSYSEGSSWTAYRVRDKLWVGGIKPSLAPGADAYAMDFEFGCQTSEKGLFVTQLADGIMGMSNGADTLPAQLMANKVTQSRIFALCFRIGGGIMTLGGVDTRIHTKKNVGYAALVDTANTGWFGVNVRNIYLRPAGSSAGALEPIAPNVAYLLGKSSAVVDSGTTDTYLPASVAAQFAAALKKVTNGLDFQTKEWKLTKKQLNKLPSIVFRLQATGPAAEAAVAQQGNNSAIPTYGPGTVVDVVMPWTSYLDNVGENLYSARIGFTEARGSVVLGSNFMTGYNVIFDPESKHIGFAQSTCNYEDFDPLEQDKDDNKPALIDGGGILGDCGTDDMIPTTECSALCNRNETAYIADGTQEWRCPRAIASIDNSAPSTDPKDVQQRPCQESCNFYRVVRGDPHCPDKPWTDCTHGCVKSRQTVPYGEKLYKDKHHNCNYHLQTSTCYAGICPLQDGDYLVYIDLRVRVEPWKWSYVHSENFFSAMASLFKLNVNAVELLNDAGSEYTAGTKLHFKIRLKAKDYKDVTAMHEASEKIVLAVRDRSFGANLVRALDIASKHTTDWPHMSRYGWMYGSDVEVLSAIAMPTSGVRAPNGEEGPTLDDDNMGGLSAQQTNLLLLGVALGAVLLLCVVVYLHMRLRHAQALYEKDKGTFSRGGQALHQMINSLASATAEGIAATAGVPVNTGSQSGVQQRDIEMSKRGLMEMDEDLED